MSILTSPCVCQSVLIEGVMSDMIFCCDVHPVIRTSAAAEKVYVRILFIGDIFKKTTYKQVAQCPTVAEWCQLQAMYLVQ